MKPQLDDLKDLISNYGFDPRTVSLEEILALIKREAEHARGRAMASVKLGKAPRLVTIGEAMTTLQNPETPGDRDLSARTWRAGEIAYQDTLVERGLYDKKLAAERAATSIDLDRGEVTVFAEPSPTNKRQAGRPSRSIDFMRMLAVDVEYRRATGEAASIEKVVEMLTGRDRNGRSITGINPVLILPSGRKSFRTIMGMLQAVARDAPVLIEEARRQGEIVKAGGQPDPAFMDRLLKSRALLAEPAAVTSMLRATRRKNDQNTPRSLHKNLADAGPERAYKKSWLNLRCQR